METRPEICISLNLHVEEKPTERQRQNEHEKSVTSFQKIACNVDPRPQNPVNIILKSYIIIAWNVNVLNKVIILCFTTLSLTRTYTLTCTSTHEHIIYMWSNYFITVRNKLNCIKHLTIQNESRVVSARYSIVLLNKFMFINVSLNNTYMCECSDIFLFHHFLLARSFYSG